ncbi:MAG: outer membrane lipoprotein carrier protein LolA [Alphaproteobacteria bacterium]|nr:outer membrane lipoprotein carrier protein LolA [Alphaproteobacteria bacterium]
MKTRILTLTTVLAAALLAAPAALPGPALAQEAFSVAPGLRLSQADKADLRRVENYFNAMTTVRSNFIQASSTGYIAQGTVWIQRPGRVRFEYAPPSPILITADGLWLTYQDNELEQTSRVPLATSAIGVIVDDTVAFDEDLRVEAVIRENNVLRVTVSRDTLLEQGKVTLTFQEQPFALKQWVVQDAQGVEVKVALLDPVFGVDIPAKTFTPNSFERNADQGR